MTVHRGPVSIVLSVLVAVGLVVDAIVHFHLASRYQLAAPGGIGEGNLFRIEAVAALLVAVYVLVRPSAAAFAMAASVGLAGVVAVLLYRYVQVPAFGPLPAMYEPLWFFSKSLSAVAEAAVALLGAAGVAVTARAGRSAATEEPSPVSR